jgi:hypothetical protein
MFRNSLHFAHFLILRHFLVRLVTAPSSPGGHSLESCYEAEMFSSCREGPEVEGQGGVAATCQWVQQEWSKRLGKHKSLMITGDFSGHLEYIWNRLEYIFML